MVDVFVVDDHSVVREGLIKILEEESDFSVCGDADNLFNVRKALKIKRPDIILLDISLSKDNETGLDFLSELRRSENPIPVMILSMHDEAVYVEQSLKEGARGYFLKSDSIETLPGAIRQVMEGKIYLSGELAKTVIEKRYSSSKEEKLLTQRELEIFNLLSLGLRRGQIAEKLSISVKTVGSHFERMKIKLNVKSLQDIIQLAISRVH
jgi:DNA-binding NarL/FixJ family response regulator